MIDPIPCARISMRTSPRAMTVRVGGWVRKTVSPLMGITSVVHFRRRYETT